MRIVELDHEQEQDVAGKLAGLVAVEHQRANEERARRELAEATATELAKLLVRDQADLEREREARQRAESRLRDLSGLALEEERTPRFVPAGRAPRPRPGQRAILQRLS
jgi:ATPase subunit of ABC transporter with duplicated ATPase domains